MSPAAAGAAAWRRRSERGEPRCPGRPLFACHALTLAFAAAAWHCWRSVSSTTGPDAGAWCLVYAPCDAPASRRPSLQGLFCHC